jgi:hypothetical protein
MGMRAMYDAGIAHLLRFGAAKAKHLKPYYDWIEANYPEVYEKLEVSKIHDVVGLMLEMGKLSDVCIAAFCHNFDIVYEDENTMDWRETSPRLKLSNYYIWLENKYPNVYNALDQEHIYDISNLREKVRRVSPEAEIGLNAYRVRLRSKYPALDMYYKWLDTNYPEVSNKLDCNMVSNLEVLSRHVCWESRTAYNDFMKCVYDPSLLGG